MIEMKADNSNKRICIVPGCSNPLPQRSGRFMLCDICRDALGNMLREIGRPTENRGLERYVSRFIKSGLAIQGFKEHLLATKPGKPRGKQKKDSEMAGIEQELDSLECPVVLTCGLAKTALEDDSLCHGGHHDECSVYKKIMSKPLQKERKEEKPVAKDTTEIDRILDEAEGEVEPQQEGETGEDDRADQHVDHDPDSPAREALIDDIIAPIMQGFRNANALLVEKGIFPRPAKIDKDMLAGELSKILEPFKQEITAMLADFKQLMRQYVEGSLVKITKDYIGTGVAIKEAVRLEVADRFRFMTSTYEDHAKQLETEEKERKRKDVLKDSRDG
jgi:hypothetical protein